MTSKAVLFCGFCFMSLAVAACSSKNEPSFPERVFTPPWSMDADAVERLRVRVNAVNVDDRIDHVVTTVGVPDSDSTVNKNEKRRIFAYYVTRQRTYPIESDKVVMIAFDRRNRVRAIYSNVENIATRDWPGHPSTK